MSIEKTNKIDFIGINKESGKVILTITDHLPWEGEQGWSKDHLAILENKLNVYLHFVESGQLIQDYPNAKGKKIIINIVGKYDLNENAMAFFEKAKKYIADMGIELQFELFKD